MAKVEDFEKEIMSILEEYRDVTQANIEKAVQETAKEAISALRGSSPSGAGKYSSWGPYLKGWKSKKNNKSKSYSYVIYNSSKPSLTHLLEKGHALRNGGRAKAFPHIAPVADEIGKNLESRIKQGIENVN